VRAEFYPVDWAEIAALVKEANGYACQNCGRHCRQPGEAFDENARTLTVAHWHNDYDAPWVQLVPLCSVCHLIHDAPYGMSARRRHQREFRRQLGQLEFTLEGKRI
jgi:hypothetical protein